MAKLTMVFGGLLVVVSLGFWFAMGRTESAALHPAGLGVLLVLCGALANTESSRQRMLWMHIAVTVGLLGFLITGINAAVQIAKGTVTEGNPLKFDERVAAALAWVKAHYRFDANPGMRPGNQRDGLFYYYGVMGRTFDLLHVTSFATPDGRTVDWRADLFQAIKSQAIPASGGASALWRNSSRRWGEQVPHITTTYMLMALKHIAATL